MCFLNDDGGKLLREERRTAVKPHKCDECKCTIEPKTKYTFAAVLFDGSVMEIKECDRCKAVREAIHAHEMAEGCDWYESWAPIGEIADYLKDRNLRYDDATKTLVEAA
jgi:hypothetical protein